MAAGDLITNDFEVEFNGVLAGQDSSYDIEVVSIDLFSSPSARLTELNRPLDHGAFTQAAYYPGFSFVATYEVWGDTLSDLQTNVSQALMFSSLTQDEIPLVVQMPGIGKIRVNCKATKRQMNFVDIEWATGFKTGFSVEYYASNPRKLSNDELSETLTLATAAGGFTYDITYDINYNAGGSGSGGAININNEGSFETRPYIDVNGPFTSFSLSNDTQGKTLEFSNVVMSASEYVRIDFLDRTILLNGTASRTSWLVDSTQWWSLDPGLNSIRLNGSSTETTTATIYWRHAWL